MENLVQLLAAWRIVCHDARPSISLSIYLSLCKYIYISKRILDKENFLFFFIYRIPKSAQCSKLRSHSRQLSWLRFTNSCFLRGGIAVSVPGDLEHHRVRYPWRQEISNLPLKPYSRT